MALVTRCYRKCTLSVNFIIGGKQTKNRRNEKNEKMKNDKKEKEKMKPICYTLLVRKLKKSMPPNTPRMNHAICCRFSIKSSIVHDLRDVVMNNAIFLE